jgi:hypothetical protein
MNDHALLSILDEPEVDNVASTHDSDASLDRQLFCPRCTQTLRNYAEYLDHLEFGHDDNYIHCATCNKYYCRNYFKKHLLSQPHRHNEERQAKRRKTTDDDDDAGRSNIGGDVDHADGRNGGAAGRNLLVDNGLRGDDGGVGAGGAVVRRTAVTFSLPSPITNDEIPEYVARFFASYVPDWLPPSARPYDASKVLRTTGARAERLVTDKQVAFDNQKTLDVVALLVEKGVSREFGDSLFKILHKNDNEYASSYEMALKVARSRVGVVGVTRTGDIAYRDVIELIVQIRRELIKVGIDCE